MQGRRISSIVFLFFVAGLFCFPVGPLAARKPPEGAIVGTMRSANTPIPVNQKLWVVQVAESYEFIPLKDKIEPWKVSFEKIRGAQAGQIGIWFYWFDEQEATQTALIAIDPSLAGEINLQVSNYHKNLVPMTTEESEKYKKHFETYQDEAIKTAK